MALNGAAPVITTYNLANQITNAGYSYDLAGNLANDGTATYTYDALNRTTARGSTAYAYNGDGTLVSQLTGGVTTRYTQDLASPLTQVLQSFTTATRTDYLYGLQRLAALQSGVKTWYVADALGSVRRTVSDTGTPLGIVTYDPWGTVESGTVPTFGFTGELQQGGLVNLRARWYHAGSGRFGSVDPFAGAGEQPYSLHPYQYAYSAPTVWTDPSGQRVAPEDGGGVGPAACRAIGWLWMQYADGHGRCLPPVPPPNTFDPIADKAQRYASAPPSTDRDPESGVKLPPRQKQTLGGVLNPPWPGALPRERGRTRGLGIKELCILLGLLNAAPLAMSIPDTSSDNRRPRKHYVQSDGMTIQEGFDPLNAQKAVKLGYDENLRDKIPDGYSIREGWFWPGLASREDDQRGWWFALLDAMENTSRINFVIDGMDVFKDPNWFKADKITHQEMDEIILRGYVRKLHLWQNRRELSDSLTANWIAEWIIIRGL